MGPKSDIAVTQDIIIRGGEVMSALFARASLNTRAESIPNPDRKCEDS